MISPSPVCCQEPCHVTRKRNCTSIVPGSGHLELSDMADSVYGNRGLDCVHHNRFSNSNLNHTLDMYDHVFVCVRLCLVYACFAHICCAFSFV